MATSSNAVLREANREVQAADHILSVVYPLVRDPKVLLGALEHERRAIESATRTVPVTEDAACALARIIGVLDGHAAAHTVFTRGGRCVIAGVRVGCYRSSMRLRSRRRCIAGRRCWLRRRG